MSKVATFVQIPFLEFRRACKKTEGLKSEINLEARFDANVLMPQAADFRVPRLQTHENFNLNFDPERSTSNDNNFDRSPSMSKQSCHNLPVHQLTFLLQNQ